jgi:hypothetical protein
MDYVHQHFKKHATLRSYDRVLPAMRCKSGFTLSIQASTAHYCTPRNNEGPYSHVEVMFLTPTQIPETFKPFFEDVDGGSWGTVRNALFANIPVGFINHWIELNGGPVD